MSALSKPIAWCRGGAAILACIALGVGVWTDASIHSVASQTPPGPRSPAKEPNSKLIKDESGRLVMEIRRPRGGGPVVRMRVPMELIWLGGLGGGALVGSGYQDPDVVGPAQRTLFLEVLLPNFEPRTQANADRFKDSIAGDVIRIKVVAASPIATDGSTIIDAIFRFRLRTLLPPVYRKLYHLELSDKPERFGLSRKGPVGNFERFRQWGSVDDIYYPASELKSRFLQCGAEEIKDSLEDREWTNKPLCNQYYYSNVLGGIVILTYRRVYLPYWNSIEKKAEDLLSSLESSNN